MEVKTAYKSLVENLNGGKRLGNLGADGRIVLKCVLQK
jgi:hypothetical protein